MKYMMAMEVGVMMMILAIVKSMEDFIHMPWRWLPIQMDGIYLLRMSGKPYIIVLLENGILVWL